MLQIWLSAPTSSNGIFRELRRNQYLAHTHTPNLLNLLTRSRDPNPLTEPVVSDGSRSLFDRQSGLGVEFEKGVTLPDQGL